MKILMINVVCGIRSTGRICTDLANALEKQGHEVKIAYGRERVPEQFQKYAVRIGSNLDVILHAIKARIFDSAGFGSTIATKKFIEWVKEYDPDVIHLHNIHGYYINVKVLFEYLKESKKKVIWTLHDCWSFTGHTAYCDSVHCMRWENGCYSCPLLSKYPATFFDKSKQNWEMKKEIFSGVSNMIIITPSKWLEVWAKKSFLRNYQIKVINNGIDTSIFYPVESNLKKKYKIENDYLLLGVSTSWDEMKGFSDFIKIANTLGEGYKILLVGLMKEQIKNLPNNIIGIERTESVEKLAQIYSAANLFLNLSYCENYPTVNLEAMACGTPVLTYDTGGSPEIVRKYGGYVIEQGDIDEVIRAIRYLRLNGKVEIKFEKEEHDNKHVILKYLELYNGI